MISEIVIACGVIIFAFVSIWVILGIVYQKNRPTKLLIVIAPSSVLIALSFLILGKYGVSHFWLLAIVFFICLAALGISFFVIVEKLTKPLTDIAYSMSLGGHAMAGASKKALRVSQSVAEGASQQASGLEESSAALEQMASLIKQNSDNALEMKKMTSEANKIVENVNAQMEEMAGAISEITRSSEETSKIIKTIDQIAFQTNLLALNAAVEAARAGEAGAGFSVVSDEVRRLAMMAKEAANNTTFLIESTLKSMKKGNELTVATQDVFTRNIEITNKMGNLIEEIAEASREQSEGIAQVSKAVAEMDQVTQKNSTEAEGLATTADKTNIRAIEMEEFVANLMNLFGVGDKGTMADAKKLVKRGIKYLKSHDEAKALQEFCDPKGKFVDRDIYLCVYDLINGRVVAHLDKRTINNNNVLNTQDSEGKYFIRKIYDIAHSKGKGNVDYKFVNPITTKVEQKRTYFERVGNLVVSAGAYL